MDAISFLRQFRAGEYAIFDFTVAFLGIFLVAPLLSKLFRKIGIEIPKYNWLFFTLPIAVITHLLIGQMTPMTRNFIDLSGHYLLKIVIIGSFFLGFRNIKKI
ncbi:MAG: hypothetical protein AAB674_00680 [Patescibacteria group bacterium]